MLFSNPSRIEEQSQFQESHSRSELRELRRLLPDQPTSNDSYSQYSQVSGESKVILEKLAEQTHTIIQLEQKLYYYRSQCLKLAEENHEMRSHQQRLEAQRQHQTKCLEAQKIKIKEDLLKIQQQAREIALKQQLVQEQSRVLMKGRKQFRDLREQTQQQFKINGKHYLNDHDEPSELLLKDRMIVDLTSKNLHLIKINAFLQEELKRAEKMLICLEIDTQNNLCQYMMSNVERLKENQNHINHVAVAEAVKINSMRSNEQDQMTWKKEIKRQSIQSIRLSDYQKQSKLRPVEQPKPQRKSNRVQSSNNGCSLARQPYHQY